MLHFVTLFRLIQGNLSYTLLSYSVNGIAIALRVVRPVPIVASSLVGVTPSESTCCAATILRFGCMQG